MQASSPIPRSTGGRRGNAVWRALWFVLVGGATLACGLWLLRAAEPRQHPVEGTADRAANRKSALVHEAASRAAAEQSQAALTIAKNRLTDARGELESFMSHLLAAPVPAERHESPPRAPTAAPPNPRFLQLQAEVETLEGRRLSMLGTMTIVHPAIQDLDLQISELKARRDLEPRELPRTGDNASLFLPPEDNVDLADNGASAGQRGPAPAKMDSTYLESQRHDYDSLSVAVAAADDEVMRLANEARAAELELARASAERQSLEKATAAEPSAGSSSTRTSWARTALQALLGLMAIGLGISAAALAGTEPRTLDSADEIQRQLRVPVLATI